MLFSLNSKLLQLFPCPGIALPLWMCLRVSVVLSCRYTPSSRQASQEEGKEWLRSHSTGGLQDTGSRSPLVSPSAMSSSATGKYHFSNLGKICQDISFILFLLPPILPGALVSLHKNCWFMKEIRHFDTDFY